MEQALDRFGRIDSLINNAGIFIGKPFTDYTPDDYAAITTVNLAGFFHITQRVIRQMVRQGGGHVVNVSTSLVDHAGRDRPSALSLGVTRTPPHDRAAYAAAALHPVGRLGEISDVVDAILYLERATFVTGEVLHVDGGQAAGN